MTIALITLGLIVLSAFFVAVEFSLMAVRRNRLETGAAHSAAARAALRNSGELTLILAAAQLGITICTLALGAVTKPAVDQALTPLLMSTGLPVAVADVAAFVLALVVVTFLHLVIGEMAPKSWAIAHPETAATVLALPTRAFMWLTRPLLRALNSTANWFIRRLGVEPVDELSSGQDRESLRELVEHSARAGVLSRALGSSVASVLSFGHDCVADLATPLAQVASLPSDATVRDVQQLTHRTGHLRIPLIDTHRVIGVVHVRDTLAAADTSAPAMPYAREPFVVPATATLDAALAALRSTGNHLAVLTTTDGPAIVGMSDILVRLFPDDSSSA